MLDFWRICSFQESKFSIWTVKAVGDLIEKADADIFVTLDLPPGPDDSVSDRKKKIIRSMRNFQTLRERFPNRTVMPVVHGRTMRELELSLQLIDYDASTPSWIGLGGVVPLLQNRRTRGLGESPECFIARAVTLVRASFPQSRIHVFGAGGTRTLPAVFALGAHLGDSIGWRQAAGYGSIFLPMKSQRVVRWNPDKNPPRKLLDESDLTQIENCRCPVCRGKSVGQRLDAFRRHFYDRSIHNAWTLLHQVQSWPRSRAALLRAISNGALGANWAKAVDCLELSR